MTYDDRSGDMSPTSLREALAALPDNRGRATSMRELVRQNADAIRAQLQRTRMEDVVKLLREAIAAARAVPAEHVPISTRTLERYLAEFAPTRGLRAPLSRTDRPGETPPHPPAAAHAPPVKAQSPASPPEKTASTRIAAIIRDEEDL